MRSACCLANAAVLRDGAVSAGRASSEAGNSDFDGDQPQLVVFKVQPGRSETLFKDRLRSPMQDLEDGVQELEVGSTHSEQVLRCYSGAPECAVSWGGTEAEAPSSALRFE